MRPILREWNRENEQTDSEPFTEEDIIKTIKSVRETHGRNHPEKHRGSAAKEVREWVDEQSGVFDLDGVIKNLGLDGVRDPSERRKVRKSVSRTLTDLVNEGIIKRHGNRNGVFRKIDRDLKQMNLHRGTEQSENIILPFGLSTMVKLFPGNITLIAGAIESGKTTALLNITKDNLDQYKVHYFNSEMGSDELPCRLKQFSDVDPRVWDKVNFYERSSNFVDVIEPGKGNLNIIDFLEIYDQFFTVGSLINEIHEKLDGALAVIALQKNAGRDEGRGGTFSSEKPRLYLALDHIINQGVGVCNRVKIVKLKNRREGIENPRGKQLKYNILDGAALKPWPVGTSEWVWAWEKQPEKHGNNQKGES